MVGSFSSPSSVATSIGFVAGKAAERPAISKRVFSPNSGSLRRVYLRGWSFSCRGSPQRHRQASFQHCAQSAATAAEHLNHVLRRGCFCPDPWRAARTAHHPG